MNSFWKSVSSVLGGTAIAQIIPIAATFLITRIYNPEMFGEFSTWLAFVSILSIVFSLRLEASLVIIKEDSARNKAVLYIFSTAIILCLCSTGVIYLIKDSPSVQKLLSDNSLLLILIPIGSLSIILNQIWQTWAASIGEYNKLIVMRISQSLITVLFQIGIGFIIAESFSLVLAFLIASFLSFIIAFIIMPNILNTSLFNYFEFKQYIVRYKNFLIYGLPADTLNTTTSQLPIILISYRFGPEIAGYLSLTMRVLSKPVSLLGNAILDVFKKHAAEQLHTIGNCKKLYINTFIVLFLASIVYSIATVFLAKPIFAFAFGPEWEFSGVIAIWLLPMFALGFIASPLSYIAYLVEKQHYDLIWQIALFIMMLTTLLLFNDYKISIISYAIGYAFLYCIYIALSYHLSKNQQ